MSKSNLILAKLIQEFGALTPRVSREIVELIDKKYIIRLDEREESVAEISATPVLSEEGSTTPMTQEEIDRHSGYKLAADVLAPLTDEDMDNISHAEDEANFSDEDRDSAPIEAGQSTNDSF